MIPRYLGASECSAFGYHRFDQPSKCKNKSSSSLPPSSGYYRRRSSSSFFCVGLLLITPVGAEHTIGKRCVSHLHVVQNSKKCVESCQKLKHRTSTLRDLSKRYFVYISVDETDIEWSVFVIPPYFCNSCMMDKIHIIFLHERKHK